jgi:hypothetical protein
MWTKMRTLGVYLLFGALVVSSSAAASPTGASATSSVYLNAPLANQAVEPTSFSPDKGPGAALYAHEYVRGLTWSSWGAAQATGSGQVSIETTRTATSPVTVTLSGLEDCGGLQVYSSYSLQLAAGAASPARWPSGQTGTFPCRVSAGGYFPDGPSYIRSSEAQGGCIFGGLNANLQFANAFPWLGGNDADYTNLPWSPRLPRGSAYTGFCRVHWSPWARPTVVGTGALRNGVKQWGAKAVLSQPEWCRELGVAYTRLTMTLYGAGEEITGMGDITASAAKKLKSEIGRPGFQPHVYKQAEPNDIGCTTGA